jgi:hypothetical protein
MRLDLNVLKKKVKEKMRLILYLGSKRYFHSVV